MEKFHLIDYLSLIPKLLIFEKLKSLRMANNNGRRRGHLMQVVYILTRCTFTVVLLLVKRQIVIRFGL